MLKRSLPFLLSTALVTPLFAQSGDVDSAQKSQAVDPDTLQQWLRDKRMISVRELGGDLSISGDVRVEFQSTNEQKNGIKQRGSYGACDRPANAWDVEFNLMLDYRTENTWAAVKVEFDNDMGQRSGTMSNIDLEKAYLGGRIIYGDTFTFDAEVGRRFFYNVFDSKIEFASLFDGLLFRFSKANDHIGDAYVNTAAFLIDDKTNHYGYVTEVGLLRFANVGINIKYSMIDWRKHFPNELTTDRYRFLVGQALLQYQCNPDFLGGRLLLLYGAFLNNWIAKPLTVTANQKANMGTYAGFTVGQVRRMGDFAIDTNFQWVQAQAIPDYDVSGIGRGNACRVGLYTNNINGSGGATTNATAVGSGNYKGFTIDALYAFTDNLTINQNYQMSWTLNKNIGPNLQFKQFETEFIYAF